MRWRQTSITCKIAAYILRLKFTIQLIAPNRKTDGILCSFFLSFILFICFCIWMYINLATHLMIRFACISITQHVLRATCFVFSFKWWWWWASKNLRVFRKWKEKPQQTQKICVEKIVCTVKCTHLSLYLHSLQCKTVCVFSSFQTSFHKT